MLGYQTFKNQLNLDETFIKNFRNNKSEYFFKIVEKKKNGEDRVTYNTIDQVKDIQKKFLKYLEKNIKLPDYIHSQKGKSHITNAKEHLGNNFKCVKLDVSNYFPSIKKKDVFTLLLSNLKCNKRIISLITDFTTINDTLYQGSKLSPFIANLKMIAVLSSDSAIFKNHRITVYCDDITVTGENPKSVASRIEKMLRKKGLKSNKQKKTVYRKKDKINPVITGLSVTDKICLPEEKEKKFKKMLADGNLSERRKNGIKTYIRQIEKSNLHC